MWARVGTANHLIFHLVRVFCILQYKELQVSIMQDPCALYFICELVYSSTVVTQDKLKPGQGCIT
jgi:hypothetical protein